MSGTNIGLPKYKALKVEVSRDVPLCDPFIME